MTHLLRTTSQRSIALMLLSLVFFTANILLLRGLALRFPGADGWAGILFRGAVGLGLLFSLYGGSRGMVFRHCFTHPRLVARGVVGAVATLLFYITIVHLGASRAIVINLSYPLFGVIIAAVWLKEAITLRAAFWILAGFAGLVLFFSDAAFARGLSFYDLVAILSAITSGIAVVFIRGLSKDYHPSTIYASQCVYGVVLTVPVAGSAVLSLPPAAWLALGFGAALVAVGQLSITVGFRYLSVAKGSSIQMLLPLLVAAGAYLFFDERLTPLEILGALLTLFATWQMLRSPSPVSMQPLPSFSSPNLKSEV